MAESARARPAAPSPQWRRLFIEKLASTSSVAAAARAARVSQTRAYRTRRSEPDFAQAWRAAISEGYLNLELEVIRRLREGDLKTDNGDKFDFANAIRLIAAHRDHAGRAGHASQSEVRNVSIAEVRASIEKKIEDAERQVARAKARGGSA